MSERLAQGLRAVCSLLLGGPAATRRARPQPRGSERRRCPSVLGSASPSIVRPPAPPAPCVAPRTAASPCRRGGGGRSRRGPDDTEGTCSCAPPPRCLRRVRVAEADVTGRASGDDVSRAVDEDQRSLFRCQDVGPLAVNVRQMAVVRLDNVGERNRLRALRALHLHVTPRSPVSSGGPGRAPMGEMPLRQAGRSMERGDQDGITVTDEVSRESSAILAGDRLLARATGRWP